MSRMDTEDTATEETAGEKPEIGLVLGELDDDRRAAIQQQLDAVDEKLAGVVAQLTDRSGRDSWRTSGVHVEVYESGQAMIKAIVDDPEEELEFNVELRPGNFFDDERPWRPGQPPRHMETSEWNVEGEALVMRVAKVSGRKYTIQETAAELEEESFESPEDAVAGFAKFVDELATLALSRDPTTEAWQSDVDEYGRPPDEEPPHEFV